MFSVENFYFILYHNLLRPLSFKPCYYHPFGTMDNFVTHEFDEQSNHKHCHHVLFIDQEPIFTDSGWWQYDMNQMAHSNKNLKLLANSERSYLKKTLCQERGMLDWYFFYHGFASLDWFRDSQYIDQHTPISNTYLSLNHLVTAKRSYRMNLTANLIKMEIAHKGKISFHGTIQNCRDEIHCSKTQLSNLGKNLIESYLCRSDSLPWKIDRDDIDGTASAHFGHLEYKMWQQSFLHVVNETVFYDQKLHLTEKIFKPIVSLRPFVLASSPGNLAYLREYGFKTFSPWIDESYDDEQDPDQRLEMIATEIYKLCQISISDLHALYQEMLPILEYNKQHFFNRFRTLISSELVENFDSCIRIWNNGRLDDKIFPRISDLDSIKTLFNR
jgi:hypothetical protein